MVRKVRFALTISRIQAERGSTSPSPCLKFWYPRRDLHSHTTLFAFASKANVSAVPPLGLNYLTLLDISSTINATIKQTTNPAPIVFAALI